MTTWNQYENALKNHDWTACMSDSYAVTLRGEENFRRIKAMQEQLAKEDKQRADDLMEKYRKIGWGEF